MKGLEIFGLISFTMFGAFVTWGTGLSDSGGMEWLGGGLVFAALYYVALRIWSAMQK